MVVISKNALALATLAFTAASLARPLRLPSDAFDVGEVDASSYHARDLTSPFPTSSDLAARSSTPPPQEGAGAPTTTTTTTADDRFLGRVLGRRRGGVADLFRPLDEPGAGEEIHDLETERKFNAATGRRRGGVSLAKELQTSSSSGAGGDLGSSGGGSPSGSGSGGVQATSRREFYSPGLVDDLLFERELVRRDELVDAVYRRYLERILVDVD